MTLMANAAKNGIPAATANSMNIDLESSHKVIGALVAVLQRNFKEDKQYSRPLMPTQANILFALDKEAARSMVLYMTAKLKDAGDFEEHEFRFTHKSGPNGEMLQRIRLEFPEGVNANIIRKMLIATDKLSRVLPEYPS